MSPRQKSYAVTEALITSDPDVEPIVVRFDDQPGRSAQVFDFGEFNDFPHLFRAFAGAFRRHHDATRRITREGAFGGTRKFFAFLREQRTAGRAIAEPADLTTELLQSYAAWLQSRNLTISTQAHYYGTVIRILGELRRSRGALFGHLVVPRRQFPGVGRHRSSRPMRKLDASTMQTLREAAWTEVQAIWSDFSRGQALLAEARARLEFERRAPDLRDLGELLVFIDREHRGVMPPLGPGRSQHVAGMIQRHGGMEAVARYLHTTLDTLAPFAILIGAETFANPEALRLFRRDCMRPDPLFEGSFIVK